MSDPMGEEPRGGVAPADPEPDTPQPALGEPRPCIPVTGTHWWVSSQALPGDPCLCGQRTWQRRRRGANDNPPVRDNPKETR